jgi:hypothetical protein
VRVLGSTIRGTVSGGPCALNYLNYQIIFSGAKYTSRILCRLINGHT